MGLSPVELRALYEVIQRIVDLEDKMNAGIVGVSTGAQYLRTIRQSVQGVIDHAEKPVVSDGGMCGWCHEYVSQDRNLYKHVQKCRAEATAEQRVAMKVAAVRLAQIARDLETK